MPFGLSQTIDLIIGAPRVVCLLPVSQSTFSHPRKWGEEMSPGCKWTLPSKFIEMLTVECNQGSYYSSSHVEVLRSIISLPLITFWNFWSLDFQCNLHWFKVQNVRQHGLKWLPPWTSEKNCSHSLVDIGLMLLYNAQLIDDNMCIT